jgi:hypothetical protein
VAHPRLSGTGYTGAQWTGIQLMNAAHKGGNQVRTSRI